MKRDFYYVMKYLSQVWMLIATNLQLPNRRRIVMPMFETTLLILIGSVVLGSLISLGAGSFLFLTKNRRQKAILLALPFGAGALLAAAFFDLLPEAFELGEPRTLLLWSLGGFLSFFLLERLASWFHHHHDHETARNEQQNRLVMTGDMVHNVIDGAAIAAAFLVDARLGVVTTLAVSAHEIPKELGTFGILMSRGWNDKKVILMNIATGVATLVTAVIVYVLGKSTVLPEAELLALASGMFIYVAASDIIPDIHEQPQRIGTLQALVLLVGIGLVGAVIYWLGV